MLAPVCRYNGRCRVGPRPADGRFLGLTGDRGRLGDGQRQATQFAPAGNSDAPGQLGLVTGAFVANFEALGAVRPPAVAFDVSLGACEAVIGSTPGRSASSALANSGGVLNGNGLVREGSSHCHTAVVRSKVPAQCASIGWLPRQAMTGKRVECGLRAVASVVMKSVDFATSGVRG